MNEKNKIVTSGKRKTSIARAVLKIDEPLRIAEKVLGKDKMNFSVEVEVKGGGEKGQIDAARLALARAIIKIAGKQMGELEAVYIGYDRNLLVADIRRKEVNKPGDSKARSMRQSSKR